MSRLELLRLSPLPPQDSVSTNFTTSAMFYLILLMNPTLESPWILTHQQHLLPLEPVELQQD